MGSNKLIGIKTVWECDCVRARECPDGKSRKVPDPYCSSCNGGEVEEVIGLDLLLSCYSKEMEELRQRISDLWYDVRSLEREID